ncbi:E3 ubiquitin-protein ligase MARCH7 isoform X1 [Micropterus dolomieu]|uniref:E3 ubiquitin-protein ligase MARCH7 isoform X1 n=1 Tax=Micropterus dolomieu TaxID=147949 RepID=UPI001E8E40C7|nr:E3 ubiquitin-protein ligase MARCH7 isoform X1 [Micropterus dolomieu]XP_045889580.1 E3 ubiquitin-protein ligase MARCH7 isoform X1 [Micropterus dolomieu]
MDSRSRRLPFCLSGSRSSYTSSPTLSSSSLGSSRLYSRETVLNNDRFPRASSAYKADLDQQSSRLLRPSRDYSSSDSLSTSWKLPSSLTSSSRSYDRPWAESPLSSRSKLTDSDGKLGMRSVLLNASDDGDSKRAKLSYSNRGLYSRTASTSVAGSTYSSNGLSSGRVTGEKQNDPLDSSWRSCHLLSRPSSSSSKPLLSRRELETKNEPSLSGLEERRRPPGLTSSLYQTDRVTSTYAQGARPKETAYSPSSTARESSLNRHLSSSTSQRPSPLVRDFSSRTPARFLNSSSTLRSSQEQMGNLKSSSDSSSFYSTHTPWYTTPLARPEASLPPRPAPEGAEPEGRRSTRCLLSRLFSRRSSQDSSSGSSSVRSLDDDGPSTGGESVDSDEGARMPSVEPEAGGPEVSLGSLRNRRADLAPIQENNSNDGYRSGLARSRMGLWREPGVGSSNGTSSGGGTGSSWLSSSLRGRCPPLLSRLRRHARNGSAHSTAGLEEGYSHPQHLLRRWDNLEHKASQDDDDDDDEEEEEEEEEGAVGLEVFGTGLPCRREDETLPELEDASVAFSPRRRVGIYENIAVSVGPVSGVESQLDVQKEKPVSSRDQEKLRKIKERLLLEDSDEEGDLCRICQMGEESASNPLIQPCRCTGSLQYVHQDCIKRWLRSKIGSGTNLEAITTCELCKEKLRLNIDNFDIQELYRTHVQSEYDEFISSGLYLVVLLHFCEQRFSDVLGAVDAAGLFNLVRILHEHMDNLEIPHGESDEEIRDNRPSIEFSDLDDDLEEEY